MNAPYPLPPASRFGSLPRAAGIGLKSQHAAEILRSKLPIGWLEVHAENYMGEGGTPHRMLRALREDYPLSIHGVGLSLGSAGPLDADHLARLAHLVERYKPDMVSEHLAWSALGPARYNDLLPVPLTGEALRVTAAHVVQVQDVLKRPILVENPSTYLAFETADYSEPDFLIELARQTGCGLLVDVNNVYVSAENHGWPGSGLTAEAWLDDIPIGLVGEVHLAGHAVEAVDGETLRIDDHGSPVADPVWALYRRFIDRVGAMPTLVEWDTDVPMLGTLLGEAGKAEAILEPARDLGPLIAPSPGYEVHK